MTMPSIRLLQGDEFLDVLYNFQMYAFRASPPFADKEGWARIVRERKGITYQALFENDKPVAAAGSTSMIQNVRSKLFPASGVWGVVTLPAERRKGYSRQVLTSLLSLEKDSGKVFTNLYPFRESFYERLGYVTHPLPIIAHLSAASLTPLLSKYPGGEVELQLIGEAFDIYRDFLTKMRQRVHGMAFFDVGDRLVAQQNKLWIALARVDGKIVGLMLYDLKGEEVSKFIFHAYRFYYTTSQGRYLLLDWIARHIDQADKVEIWLPSYEQPEMWLADMQVKSESQDRAPMSRILNIAQIGGMEVGNGSFCVRITDPVCLFNAGLWKFESISSKLIVSKTDDEDCELSIQGLTALVFGTHDPQDFPLRGWGNPGPEIQSVMRTMFPPRTPYLHEIF
ncbi:MAG: GNAT family N-acetyltransferase [Chloroflexota bacterium]